MRRSTLEEAHEHPQTAYLSRPGGRIAYDVAGSGPLVVFSPGMGDVRSTFRRLATDLGEAGFTAATADLRGHGESDTTFASYGDAETASDLLALVAHLGSRAILVGCSMAAAAAVIAAAKAPAAIVGLVLVGPVVRDAPVSLAMRIAQRVTLWRPWGPAAWAAYYTHKLNPGPKPDGLADHVAEIRMTQARRGAWRSFIATTRTSHAEAEARLGEVTAPTLVIMGDADPDFRSPRDEATFLAERLGGEVLLVPGAGHYPHAHSPELVGTRVHAFADAVAAGA